VAKKKRKPLLPRVTVLGLNRRELTNFVLAVEALALHVEDLRQEVAKIKAKRSTKTPEPQPVMQP
jgi:hypothetical protein